MTSIGTLGSEELPDTARALLEFGGVPIALLAIQAGGTPFYAYDRRAIADRVLTVREGLPESIRIRYAIKANPMPALVSHMAALVHGFDVASAGELRCALDAGMSRDGISFAGPGKRRDELLQAVAAGVLINVESFREIRILGDILKESDLRARVAVRVNPTFELKASGMRMGGGAKPFGVDAELVLELLREIDQSKLRFEGFHIFCGSQSLQTDAICESHSRALDLGLLLARESLHGIETMNIGGGLGIPYSSSQKGVEISSITANLRSLANKLIEAFPNAKLVMELGRYLVGEGGIYVCRVLDRKVSRGKVFLVTDGGLHHHLAASGNFGQILRRNFPIRVGSATAGPGREVVTVVGPLCTPLDVIADNVVLPTMREGDLLVVLQSGAYGLTASPVRFLDHPLPKELLI